MLATTVGRRAVARLGSTGIAGRTSIAGGGGRGQLSNGTEGETTSQRRCPRSKWLMEVAWK